MKTTPLFFCCLLLVTTISAVKRNLKTAALSTSFSNGDFEFLEKTQTGGMITSLAQLHLQMGGAIEDLVSAITELYSDLERKISEENSNWSFTSDQHEQRAMELQNSIDYADGDIKTSTQKLQNVILPLERQIESEISNLSERLQEEEAAIEREKKQRAIDLSGYNEKLQEYGDGIEGCDDAIKLVNQMMDSSPSLVQIRKAKNSVGYIQRKLAKNNQYSPFIKALTQLAIEQNFSDQETVLKIVDLLNNLRDNLNEALEELKADEQSNEKNYNEWLEQLNQEVAEFQSTLQERQTDLKTTKANVENETNFQTQRSTDLQEFQKDLETENNNFEALLQAHNNLISALEDEEKIVNEAIDTIQKMDTQDTFSI